MVTAAVLLVPILFTIAAGFSSGSSSHRYQFTSDEEVYLCLINHPHTQNHPLYSSRFLSVYITRPSARTGTEQWLSWVVEDALWQMSNTKSTASLVKSYTQALKDCHNWPQTFQTPLRCDPLPRSKTLGAIFIPLFNKLLDFLQEKWRSFKH